MVQMSSLLQWEEEAGFLEALAEELLLEGEESRGAEEEKLLRSWRQRDEVRGVLRA